MATQSSNPVTLSDSGSGPQFASSEPASRVDPPESFELEQAVASAAPSATAATMRSARPATRFTLRWGIPHL